MPPPRNRVPRHGPRGTNGDADAHANAALMSAARQRLMRQQRRQGATGAKGAKGAEPMEEISSEQIAEYKAEAEELLQAGDPRSAARIYRQLLQWQPTHTRWMDALAEVQLEMGKLQQARQLLQQSIELAPTDNFAKYMYAGQLVDGLEAVALYKKGITLMEEELNRLQIATEEAEPETLRRTLSSALCAVVDIYMTDLCFEEDAETQASNAALRAVEIDPANPDAGQTLASVRISQNNKEGALDALLRSIQIWRSLEVEPPVQDSLTEEELDQGPNEFDDPDADEKLKVMPSFPSRINSAKLLMELEQYPLAIDILDDLLEEDDMVPDIWHLMGVAYRLSGDLASAASHLLTAQDVLNKLVQSNPEEEDYELREQLEVEFQEIPADVMSEAIPYETGAIFPGGDDEDEEDDLE
eukprot:TRINITY_DN4196_c0_g1_i2.p1 TRINITY_DN4196_c0_g1~~TRINITY_DN4196_c0_g1_i2.p1  ORF type:complete len:414 (+),score=98.99 TRINITY_DN4196_c0_g1_i2:46-1287(+)